MAGNRFNSCHEKLLGIRSSWKKLPETNMPAYCLLWSLFALVSLLCTTLVGDWFTENIYPNFHGRLIVKTLFWVIGFFFAALLFAFDLKKEKTTKGEKFSFYNSWILVFLFLVMFLFREYLPANKPETDRTSFRVYIANGSVGSPDMISDSQMLTQDKPTVMLLPPSRNITMKLVSAKKMMIRTMVVNFYFDLPDIKDIEPVGPGWMPAEPESSINQMTEQVYPDFRTTRWVWYSNKNYYSDSPYCVNSLVVTTNVPNGTLKARVEVFSDRSDTQIFPVEFEINK
jgi:hypothetical protein